MQYNSQSQDDGDNEEYITILLNPYSTIPSSAGGTWYYSPKYYYDYPNYGSAPEKYFAESKLKEFMEFYNIVDKSINTNIGEFNILELILILKNIREVRLAYIIIF